MSDSYDDVPLKIEWVKDFDRSYLERQVGYYRQWADDLAYAIVFDDHKDALEIARNFRERRATYDF
jgi:hypothetical protein